MEQQRLPGQGSRAGRFMAAPASRKDFIRYVGLSGVAATLLPGCLKAVSNFKQDGKGPTNTVGLGTGDTGILNYAYVLEQVEAAFYTVVAADPYENIDSLALSRLTDIRNHEIAHREFFKNLLGKNAIQALTFNFTSVNFADKTSVLATAKMLEDLGVAAYNGVGWLIVDSEWLTIVGKIVSVEARHAAYIAELSNTENFAGATVTSDGREKDKTPAQVLTLLQPFVTETLDGSGLPTA